VGLRREGRELALQTLYALDLNPVASNDSLRQLRENAQVPSTARNFAEELVKGVAANREAIDGKIVAQSKNWTITRISRVDLNILRIAIYELLFRSDIPKNVTINEAIEVAKKFGTEESPAFVNGILDEAAASMPDKD
jgi:transcription antitermination protein NusB